MYIFDALRGFGSNDISATRGAQRAQILVSEYHSPRTQPGLHGENGWGWYRIRKAWESVWRFLKKLQIELPAILLSGIYPK
jgi:hypothetical protein